MTPGGAGGSGSGSGAPSVFLPPGQAGAASSLGDIFGPLASLSANAGAGTPAGTAYGPASSAIYSNVVNNPYANQAIWGADQASQNAFNIAAPQAFGGAQALSDASLGGLPYATRSLQQGFDPRYDAAISSIQNNPYYGQALGGAQAAAGMGAQGANAIQGLGGQMAGAVSPLLQSGFDPQSALFNRTEGRLMDQTNAANAMSGVNNSPYGASVMGNTMGNFDIDWQNQQLARQTQAAQAAGGAANTAGGLYGAAPGLMASSAGLPSGVYGNNIGQMLSALSARNQGANQGAAGYGALLGAGGTGLTQGNALNLSGIGAQQQFGAAPYNAGVGVGNNTLSSLSNLTNLGNNQFALPQQAISDLMQYMGLGQSASQINQSLANSQFGQQAQGLGGLLSGANTLFGNNSLLGGSSGIFGSGGIGGLLGGGAGAGSAFTGGIDAGTTALDALMGSLMFA